jgi:hypothetical protein
VIRPPPGPPAQQQQAMEPEKPKPALLCSASNDAEFEEISFTSRIRMRGCAHARRLSLIRLACASSRLWMLYRCLCLWRGKIGVIYYAYIEKPPGVEVIKR